MEHTFSILSAALLGGLLAGASWSDVRTRRIPNRLVLVGTLAGLALNALLPPGMGLFSTSPGSLGFVSALGGFAIGLGALLPLYLLRTMGAGDVKLMAMSGAFLGPVDILGAVVMTLLAGGILGIAVALKNGVLRSTLTKVRAMIMQTTIMALTGQDARIDPVPASAAGTLPYALAITTGTCVQILLARSGHAIFS
jgi:prepilin peptidase CpaA